VLFGSDLEVGGALRCILVDNQLGPCRQPGKSFHLPDGIQRGNTLMTEQKVSHVRVSGKVKYTQDITVRGHRLTADEPAVVGGGDAGPGPYDFLLAGLGACTAITLRMLAEKKGWELGEIGVELVLFKDENRADRIERRVKFGAPLSPEQLAKIAEVCERTPVTLTIKQGAPITTHLIEQAP
jgi:putative redox protein